MVYQLVADFEDEVVVVIVLKIVKQLHNMRVAHSLHDVDLVVQAGHRPALLHGGGGFGDDFDGYFKGVAAAGGLVADSKPTLAQQYASDIGFDDERAPHGIGLDALADAGRDDRRGFFPLALHSTNSRSHIPISI